MNKKHWYDGLFYSLVIDKGGVELRNKISNFIRKDSNVIDVACGTGELVFKLAGKCNQVVGVELSSKMFKFAKSKNDYSNIKFYHMSAANLSNKFKKQEFDYAVISFALHEMSVEDRIKVLKQMKKVANELIIADFTAPLPKKFQSNIIRLVEFLAGKEHYTNHKSFMKQEGVKGLLKKLDLKVKKEILGNKTGSSKIFIV